MILQWIETQNTKFDYEIDNGKLTCIKQNHHKPVLKVIIDKSILISDSFLCEICLLQDIPSANIIGMRLFEDIMKNFRFDTQEDVLKYMEENQLRLINFERESKQIFGQVFVENETLQGDYKPQYGMVKYKKEQQQDNTNQTQEKYNISQVSLVKRAYLQQQCQALAFSHQNSILFAAEGNCVKMWKLLGFLKYLRKFDGPKGQQKCVINFFVLNKSANWIALGSNENSSIRCWKYNGVLSSIETPNKHRAAIMGLLLNKKEDELITFDSLHIIIIWKVNCIKNEIEFHYTVNDASMEEYDGPMYMSLNESETYLVCGLGGVIILWTKGKDNYWVKYKKISLDHCGLFTQFIDDSSIIYSQEECQFYEFLEITDGLILRRNNISFDIEDDHLPSYECPILNKRKKIIIQSHYDHFNIFRQQEDGQLKLIADPVNFSDHILAGALSQNAEFLVGNGMTRIKHCIRIYKISYK